jgi:PilZ domain
LSQEHTHSHSEVDSVEKLVHLALPVRLTHMANGGRGGDLEMACTYDIHPRGARLLSLRDVRVGDMVTVERGRQRSVCQVVWTADPNSALRGQFTVECMEGSKIPWEDELRQMQETYLPIAPLEGKKPAPFVTVRKGENRRRSPRFQVQGGADLLQIEGESRLEGQLAEISGNGCMIQVNNRLAPGTGLRMILNMYDVSVALKGNVRYATENRSMGVEFQEIRQGDRPLLDYVLSHLKKPLVEDFSDLEVITESVAAG